MNQLRPSLLHYNDSRSLGFMWPHKKESRSFIPLHLEEASKMTSNDETMTSSLDDVDSSISPSRPITQLTSTEPYPGPGLIESATQFVKNWVRQGYNDFMAGG